MYPDFLYTTVFDKMSWPGNETHEKSPIRYEANQSEEYEHSSSFRNHSLHLRPPEGVSAIARNIEDILNPGWGILPPQFASAQLPPPSVNGSYLPPTEGLLHAMQADLRVTQQAEAARTLRENQSRELLMAAGTATSFPGQVPGQFYGAPFQYQGVPHPPWASLTSTAYAAMVPSVPPESTIFRPSDIAAAPYQSLSPHQSEVAFPQHEFGDAAAARALVEDKIRYSTTEAGPREKRRQRSRVNDPFPVKLLRLLSEVESNGNEHVVSFTPSGLAFQVHKPDEFMRDVAPKYFRQKKFSSFTRQLNMYGFEKVNHGPDKGSFSHADFQRGKPELCTRILARVPEDYRSARAL